MNQIDAGPTVAASLDALGHLLESLHIRLGQQQRRRLEWLVAQCGRAIVWDSRGAFPRDARLVIVMEPPSGPAAELFFRSLHPRCVVVIPFGENPSFDFLKSKLRDFGTCGPSGADGPHEVWWGGISWSSVVRPTRSRQQPLIVSCHPHQFPESEIARLTDSLTALNLDFVVEAIDTMSPVHLLGFEKANFILDIWQRSGRPVLWVDPDAILAEPPSLIAQVEGDFAVHKWNRWEMATRTLYFGRSEAAEALLRTWHRFLSSYVSVWEGYLLDQAWSLVSSQMSLDTVWLPRAYHETADDSHHKRPPVIVHALPAETGDLGPDPDFPRFLRAARRASRTGAPESLIVLKANEHTGDTLGPVTVILRDIQLTGARAIAAAVEGVTGAFANDSGGFGHLELSLCRWQEDVRAATSIASGAQHRILELAPTENLPGDMFRRLAQSADGAASTRVLPLRGDGGRSGAALR
jgi:hypothetical protein